MKQIDIFTLAQHTKEYDKRPLETELLREGQPTGKKVPGYVLEAQYEHENYYLIVTSWDCPFEEAQTFLLLSYDLDVLSEKTIGAAYATVWMEGHKAVGVNSALFNCDGDLDVLATILSNGRLKIEKFDRRTGKRWPPLHKRMRIKEFSKAILALIIFCLLIFAFFRYLKE